MKDNDTITPLFATGLLEMMFRDHCIRAIGLAAAPSLLFIATAIAAERRAPAPSFSSDSYRGVFFSESSQAIRGQRPRMGATQAPVAVAKTQTPSSAKASEADAASGFSALISPATLEDEIKRLRLEFDAGITTPAAFQSGGFQDARVRLTILASLFAIITEHSGEVRWKKDAPAARDLLARTALNCKSGSGQVYNEVKQRKNDLEDLVAGTGLANRQAEAENDWSMIADRVPLMIYMESLLEGPLKEGTRDASAVKAQGDQIRRAAQLIAASGEILTKEGLAGADEDEYAELCREMTKSAGSIVLAVEQGDAAAVSAAVGAVSQSCAKCHETYR